MARSRAAPVPAALVVILFSSAVLVSGDSVASPDRISDVLKLPDGVAVTLHAVVVQDVLWPYIFVRDVWDSQTILPVYANALVERWWSLDITGTTATIGGKRVLIAEHVLLYADSEGKPFILYPGWSSEAADWPYMLDVPIESAAPDQIPPPPDPQPREPSGPLTAPEGTIAWGN